MTPENGKSLVQSYDCLDKVVIVDTAHKVRQEVLSNLKNMGKNISLFLLEEFCKSTQLFFNARVLIC